MGRDSQAGPGAVVCDEATLRKRTRVLVLSGMLLLGMLFAQVVFTNKLASPTPFLRIYGWTLVGFSGVVAAQAVHLAWVRWRGRTQGAVSTSKGRHPMKGLLNWEQLIAELASPACAESSDGKQTHLLHLELLGLKRINFENGRAMGDAVLGRTVELIRSHVPEGWSVGSVGGPQFVVIAPRSTAPQVRRLSWDLHKAVRNITREVGLSSASGDVSFRSNVVPYEPGAMTPQQALEALRLHGVHSERLGPEAGAFAFHHLLQVGLEAFAVHSWDALPEARKAQFEAWRKKPSSEFLSAMVDELLAILDLTVQKRNLDFVTVPPSESFGHLHAPPAWEALGNELAEQLSIPFRKVLRPTEAVGLGETATRYGDVRVDGFVEARSSVLLVQDLVVSPRFLRRSLSVLSQAHCHVLVLAWAAKTTEAEPSPTGAC